MSIVSFLCEVFTTQWHTNSAVMSHYTCKSSVDRLSVTFRYHLPWSHSL